MKVESHIEKCVIKLAICVAKQDSSVTSGAPKVHSGAISMPIIKPHPRTSEIKLGNFFCNFLAKERSCSVVIRNSNQKIVRMT